MTSLEAVYLVDAVRTPIGKHRGALKSVRADDLAAHVLRELCAREPMAKERIDQVVLGATNQAGEDNRNVARMALLLADLPYEVPAVTVNRLCGSGLEAILDGARMIATGDANVVLAGGVESMTRAPYSMPKADEAFARTPPAVYDTSLGWRYPNPRMAERFPLLAMGETAEEVAKKHGISREEQDVWAVRSQQHALAAWERDAFSSEVAPIDVQVDAKQRETIARDESPRATSLEQLGKLKPVFRKDGSVTAGNSSPLNDGAACVLLASERAVRELSLKPVLRLVASATAGVHPNVMGEGPIPATQRALARAGWSANDLDRIELNEAFAAQVLACVRGLQLDPARVNVNGGAIALGHPIGCSGARIVTTLLHMMRADASLKRGLTTLCVGVGQGIAALFERA
jgi:acetyl-CoA acyltransferase